MTIEELQIIAEQVEHLRKNDKDRDQLKINELFFQFLMGPGSSDENELYSSFSRQEINALRQRNCDRLKLT